MINKNNKINGVNKMKSNKKKIGRNDKSCCDSNKKYKKCCLIKDELKEHIKLQKEFEKDGLVGMVLGEGFHTEIKPITHPITNEKGVIKTNLIKGEKDDDKKEIHLTYEISDESTDWCYESIKVDGDSNEEGGLSVSPINNYLMGLIGDMEKELGERLNNELDNQYTIMFWCYFPNKNEKLTFSMNVWEPKNKGDNRFFPIGYEEGV